MIIDCSSTVASGVSVSESSRLRPLAIHRCTDRPMMRDPMKCTAAAMTMTKAMNSASVQKPANQSQKGCDPSAGGVVSSARLITGRTLRRPGNLVADLTRRCPPDARRVGQTA